MGSNVARSIEKERESLEKEWIRKKPTEMTSVMAKAMWIFSILNYRMSPLRWAHEWKYVFDFKLDFKNKHLHTFEKVNKNLVISFFERIRNMVVILAKCSIYDLDGTLQARKLFDSSSKNRSRLKRLLSSSWPWPWPWPTWSLTWLTWSPT